MIKRKGEDWIVMAWKRACGGFALAVLCFSGVLCGCVETSNTYRMCKIENPLVSTGRVVLASVSCEYGDFELIGQRQGVAISRERVVRMLQSHHIEVSSNARYCIRFTQAGFSRIQSLPMWCCYWLGTLTVMTRSEAAYPMAIKVIDVVDNTVVYERELSNEGVIWAAHLPLIGSLDELVQYRVPSSQYFDSWRSSLISEASSALHEYDAHNRKEHDKGDDHSISMSTGTGWFVNSNYVVTCHHVIKGARTIRAISHAGTEISLVLAAADERNDLAVLKAMQGSPSHLALKTGGMNISDKVHTVGYPLVDVLGMSPKFTEGTISSTKGMRDENVCYQITVPVQPGNSGGALMDENGAVVGIVSSRLGDLWTLNKKGIVPQNVNYAVKVAYLKILLDDNKIDYFCQKETGNVLTQEQRITQQIESVVHIRAEN